jgi:polysaccharide chain length determinant protein (PEP-CTERM system associated)
METSITPRDIYRMIRRRAVMIVTIVGVCSTVALMLAYFIPPTYVASAKILIESQQIPQQLASSTVTSSVRERLELIRQRLLTRNNLLSMIERLGLYADRPDLSAAGKVGLMRSSVELEKIQVPGRRRGGAVSAFVLSYRDSDPERAARIANEFVTLVIEQNLRERSERASQTREFFADEVDEIEAELQAAEADLAAFQNANEMALPDSLGQRRRELERLREGRFQLRARIVELEQQKSSMETALETGRYADAVGESMTQEERDLQALRQELARAESLYADSHPRVRMLRARIGRMAENLAAVDPGARLETKSERVSRIRAELERRLEAVETELGLVREQLALSETREERLVDSIERTPEVEMALRARQRRLDELRIRYEQAVRKEAFAETGERLEVTRQAERFEVIEQAQVPGSPTSPNRPAIAVGGVAGSVGLALGLAILLGLLNPSIRTVGDMERKLEIRPLMTVPYITTEAERRRQRRELWLLGSLVLVVIPIGLYLVDQYYLPLELIIDRVIDRLDLRLYVTRFWELFGQ